jgi:hypothetical protein
MGLFLFDKLVVVHQHLGSCFRNPPNRRLLHIAGGFVIDFLVVSALIRLESSSVVTFGERFIEATANGKSPMCIISSSTARGFYADQGLRSSGLRCSVTGKRNSGVDLAYNTLSNADFLPDSKLRERDHDFFEQHVLRDGFLTGLAELVKIKLPNPQRRIASKCLYFVEEVKKLAPEQRNALAAFLLQHTYLVVVSTPDLDSAFRIFSVLNDRGLDLTAASLPLALRFKQAQSVRCRGNIVRAKSVDRFN